MNVNVEEIENNHEVGVSEPNEDNMNSYEILVGVVQENEKECMYDEQTNCSQELGKNFSEDPTTLETTACTTGVCYITKPTSEAVLMEGKSDS